MKHQFYSTSEVDWVFSHALGVLMFVLIATRQISASADSISSDNSSCLAPVINNNIQIFTSEICHPTAPGAPDTHITPPRDCVDVQRAGFHESGKYQVTPDGANEPFWVYCDMETNGGGWTVFQRRQNGEVDFYRGWSSYKNGFGLVDEEHWLGNDKLRLLTAQKRYRLRVDLGDWEGATRYAEYDYFLIGDEHLHYRLTLGQYSGTAEDSMRTHNGKAFSTYDADYDTKSDGSCARNYHGAFWYHNCYDANLNGKYYMGGIAVSARDGNEWEFWRIRYSLKTAEMKIRAS